MRGYRPWVTLGMVFLIVIVLWLWSPATLYPWARYLGSAVCAQNPVHSYHAWGSPLPLCARCTGLHLGTLAALLYLIVRGRWRRLRWPGKAVWGFLGLLVILWIGDGLNSFLAEAHVGHLYPPINGLRFLTGFAFGIVWMVLFWPLWATAFLSRGDSGQLLETPGEVGALLLVGGALVLLMEVGGDRTRYALGLMSILDLVGGVGGLLGIVICTFPRVARARMSLWKRVVCLGLGLAAGLTLLFTVAWVRAHYLPI